MLNFEPHKLTYKISIEVGRLVGRSFIARIQPTIIRLTLRRLAISMREAWELNYFRHMECEDNKLIHTEAEKPPKFWGGSMLLLLCIVV